MYLKSTVLTSWTSHPMKCPNPCGWNTLKQRSHVVRSLISEKAIEMLKERSFIYWVCVSPASQVHSHHIIHIALENACSCQVLKHNPGRIIFMLAKWTSNLWHWWESSNLLARRCISLQTTPGAQAARTARFALSTALYTTCIILISIFMTNSIKLHLTPSEHQWICHWPANCRWRQSSSSSTQHQSQRAPYPHPWLSGC